MLKSLFLFLIATDTLLLVFTACPEGETFKECPPPKCDAEFCPKTKNDPQTCPYPVNDKRLCQSRCVCGFNSHRDRKTGKCIATSSCPPFKCDKNEVFYDCAPGCPGDTCKDYLNNATCPIYRIGIVVPCKLGCKCKKGFYRNSSNQCVPAAECKKESGSASGSSTSEVTTTATSTTQGSCDAAAQQKALELGNTITTGSFFYEEVVENPGTSVFMSVFSVLEPLAILALYAENTTYTQLSTALNVKDKSDIRCGFPGLLKSITATNGTELDIGAKIYVTSQANLSKPLIDDSKNVFDAEAESINFGASAAAANVINQWVSDETRGKITQLVGPDTFDDSTVIALINAIYFKGVWQTKFNANDTKPRDFYTSNGKTIQVPTMTVKSKFEYGEDSNLGVKILKMPYQDGGISFVVILPDDKDGLVPVLDKLRNPTVFTNLINSVSTQTVTVFLPKFSISTTIDLKQVLQKIGVSDVFDSGRARLSGMTDPNIPLYVSAAKQKATIEIDENGAVAAAANAFILNRRSLVVRPEEEYIFDADHPFIFYIKRENLILFSGSYV